MLPKEDTKLGAVLVSTLILVRKCEPVEDHTATVTSGIDSNYALGPGLEVAKKRCMSATTAQIIECFGAMEFDMVASTAVVQENLHIITTWEE